MTAQHGPNAGGKHSFDAQGDSADIWHGPRRWVLPASMKYGFITFDFKPDREYARGDRYELQFKLKQLRSNFKTFIAVDYEDGSTAIAHRYSCNDGWNSLPIQSDNKKTVRRIYGYVNYNVMRGDIAFVDSLLMLRTHCGENIINEVGQKLIERNKSAAPASSMAEEKKPDAPVAHR